MPSAVFEPGIPGTKRPLTYTLGRNASEIGCESSSSHSVEKWVSIPGPRYSLKCGNFQNVLFVWELPK